MLDHAGKAPIRFDPDQASDRGAPTTTRQLYLDPTGAFKAGFWSSEPGKAEVHYRKDEICTLLAGVVRLTDEGGRSQTFQAGDTFVVPSGFRGIWETVLPTRKFFATHTPAGKA